jgi:aspartate/methionine/tyrosine aminotransferase
VSVSPARRLSEVPRSGIRAAIEAPLGDVIDLASGDPSFPTPAHISEAAAQAARSGQTHYTHGCGEIRLREALVRKLAAENDLFGIDPELEIVVTSGGLNGLAATFQALLDPGDEVLVPDPGFANYTAQVMLAGGRPSPVPLVRERQWSYDCEALARSLTPRTRILVVNSPSNPTGAVLPRAALEELAEFAAEHDLIVVSDEAYEQLVYDGSHCSIAACAGARERTVSVYSFSKTYAMTGWRVGYVVAPSELAAEIAKVQEHLIGCPSSVSQAAALAALAGPPETVAEMVVEYRRRRDLVTAALEGTSGVSLVAPAGALYAFPCFESLGPNPSSTLFEQAGVQVVPGEAFGRSAPEHVRLSFAGDAAELEEGLLRIRQTVGVVG